MTGADTATEGASGRRRAVLPLLVLTGLVVVSTAVRLAVAQSFTTPWIAPDEMVYGMLGESLWSNGTLGLRDLPSPYYSVLTPALIGAPLAWLDLADGIQWARLLQALAASLVAVPTYLWARSIASMRWALAAAGLVLLAPALHYAGFLMTEPLTLTVVTIALLAMAHALQRPSMWRYGVFAAWATAAAAVRLQALVLLPAFLAAALLDALAARDGKRLRPLLLLGGVAVGVTVAVALLVVVFGGELSTERVLGAYTPIGEGAPVESGADAIAWHAFDVALLGFGVAALATAALAACVLSGRDTDPVLRAFVAVTLAYVGLLVLQVGLFSAAYVGHVAERYLITALPLLAIGLCAWISRGAPRPRVTLVVAGGILVVAAVAVPIDEIASQGTLVNAPTSAMLAALSDGWARLALVGGAVAACALVLLLPRRLAWVTAAVLAVGLATASADSARRIADQSSHEQRVAEGTAPPGWLDAADVGDATLVDTGDRLWTATARTIFWNRSIDDVVHLLPATSPFPPVTPAVRIGADGILRTLDGAPLRRRVVVAPKPLVFAGEKVAEHQAGTSEAPGLVAWRQDGDIRAVLRTGGFLPNGDFSGIASITVYRCRPGTLDVTILGKSGDPIEARVDELGASPSMLETPAGEARTHHISAPPYANGTTTCLFELVNPGFAGTTTITFTPR